MTNHCFSSRFRGGGPFLAARALRGQARKNPKRCAVAKWLGWRSTGHAGKVPRGRLGSRVAAKPPGGRSRQLEPGTRNQELDLGWEVLDRVGTNGVISTQDFPRETQYVDDDFPTDFPAIAPFLADLDTTGSRGNIYYRQDDSSDVLDRAAGYIRAGFPEAAASFAPTNAFLATWEDVGAYEELSPGMEPSKKLNTFQAVVAYDAVDAYAIFLYPDDGLQFFGTRPKESYNVHLELPARVGFSRGDGDDPKRDGLFYSVASSERALKHLYQASNVMVPGVWVFHIGSASPLANVVPGLLEIPEEQEGSLDPDAPRSLPANPTSYRYGQHGVRVEEDVSFNTDV
ncbi:PREDICTED: nidogen-2 [Tinamus guttatus]|uniref:nidogen-2 n=1 Tax=Tinamus guttatus TaxID=94827 RepID=UPI00052EBCA6|nr:PREDICTED: nidogen-2 [Tinamus guttatus]